MSENQALADGRYLLLLDILGFSNLVKTRGQSEILEIISDTLNTFEKWERLNQLFRTIYFSDTFLFYQVPKGYGSWAFLDVYAIGSFILTGLLAKGIPARGAIAFGGFEVYDGAVGRHQIYFGQALVEAHEAEQRENWVGITILPSAWKPFEKNDPGVIDCFASEHAWLKRDDDVLLLNPFVKLRGWHVDDLIGEIDRPYLEWDAPEFPNEIRAFKFLRDTTNAFAAAGDYSTRTANKYHATSAFISQVFGSDLYDWACKISQQSDA